MSEEVPMTDQRESSSKMVTLMTDGDGNMSSMRIMGFGALIVAAVLSIFPMLGWAKCEVDGNLVLYFLIAAFGGKSIQKFAERGQ